MIKLTDPKNQINIHDTITKQDKDNIVLYTLYVTEINQDIFHANCRLEPEHIKQKQEKEFTVKFSFHEFEFIIKSEKFIWYIKKQFNLNDNLFQL